MRTGVLSGRSYLRPVSVKTASVAHVFVVLRVITSTAAWPFRIVTLAGTKPCSVTAMAISFAPPGAQPGSVADAITSAAMETRARRDIRIENDPPGVEWARSYLI